jgi:hypothetical protein
MWGRWWDKIPDEQSRRMLAPLTGSRRDRGNEEERRIMSLLVDTHVLDARGAVGKDTSYTARQIPYITTILP